MSDTYSLVDHIFDLADQLTFEKGAEAVRQRLGKYQILNRIGGGAQADVYKAFDTVLESEVALKVFRGSASGEQTFVTELRKEATISRGLLHPNIVVTYDFSVEDDIAFMVMEYLERNLADEIHQPMGVTIDRGVSIVLDIARALKYAHDQNIVHRDVKPLNIMMTKGSVVKLGDFGIARAGTFSTTATRTLGTPAYMAPEQWEGSADSRSDIYSLGVLLYEILAGSTPHSGPDMSSFMVQHQREPVPPFDTSLGVPTALADIAFRCLEKPRENRYQNMGEMIHALETWLTPPSEESDVFEAPGELTIPQLIESETAIETLIEAGSVPLVNPSNYQPHLVNSDDTAIPSGIGKRSPGIVLNEHQYRVTPLGVLYTVPPLIGLASLVFGFYVFGWDFLPVAENNSLLGILLVIGGFGLIFGLPLFLHLDYEPWPGPTRKRIKLRRQAHEYFRTRRYAESISQIDELLQIDARNPRAYYNRGLCQQIIGNPERALADYTNAISLSQSGRQKGSCLNNRGMIYSETNLPNRAIRDYTLALRFLTERGDEVEYKSVLYNRGNLYYDIGDYRKAARDYTNVMSSVSKDAWFHLRFPLDKALHNWALTYAQLGDYPRAKRTIQRALRLDIPPEVAARYKRFAQEFDFID